MGTVHALPLKSDPLERLDTFRLYERCVVDQIAEAISQHLYTRSYDRLPMAQRVHVEGAALRAIRHVQKPWNRLAVDRAVAALDKAMAEQMGAVFASLSPADRQARARIGVAAVRAAICSVLEVEDPFDGPVDALRVYVAAEADAKEVR